jgi:hypothetical protein
VYNGGELTMKVVLLVLFILNGCFFLLVGTVLYPAITHTLIGIEKEASGSLPTILNVLRIICICAGAFLVLYGAGMFLFRNRWNL